MAITVEARIWMDFFGNSYHSVRIFKKGVLTHFENCAYGSHSLAMTTAASLLGISYTEFGEASCKDGLYDFSYKYVKRKKDL